MCVPDHKTKYLAKKRVCSNIEQNWADRCSKSIRSGNRKSQINPNLKLETFSFKAKCQFVRRMISKIGSYLYLVLAIEFSTRITIPIFSKRFSWWPNPEATTIDARVSVVSIYCVLTKCISSCLSHWIKSITWNMRCKQLGFAPKINDRKNNSLTYNTFSTKKKNLPRHTTEYSNGQFCIRLGTDIKLALWRD